MKISYIFLFSLISLSLSLMVKIEGSHGRYCFMKKLYSEEQINLNFLVSSEKKEELDVKFKNDDKGNILFQTLNDDQSGWYQSPRPLPIGNYSLCFYPKNNDEYFITFELYDLFDGAKGLKELAKDKEFKQMGNEVGDIKKIFGDIETNLKYAIDRKSRHFNILNDIISSIKNLTFFKLGIVFLLSVFQIIVIQKFFGPDKRVSSVKGAFSDGL